MARERVVERLNRALHAMFAEDPQLYLLGEDIADPYGGAFKVTRGLSTSYPDRVLTTPLSENAIVGAGAGLALCGNRVLVEVMFGDFIGLAFDQLLNFASKSVQMYGRTVPMSLVVRCTVGGRRGYGPTHSQSPQKHFVGVPHLRLYELSPLHHPQALLRQALGCGEPGILFEDKVLYTQPTWPDGDIDDDLRSTAVEGPGHWYRVSHRDGAAPGIVVIVPGGMAATAVAAVRALRAATGLRADVLVPGQLYPLALEPVRDLLAATGLVCVAEESTAGGTWGAEVAARLHEELWTQLRAPVCLVHSAATVIPAAPHLERTVLVQTEQVADALAALARRAPVNRSAAVHRTATHQSAVPPTAAADQDNSPGPQPECPPPDADAIVLPTLNPNDTEAILVAWLVGDGMPVTAGTPIAEAETSKAVNEIEADRDGVLRIVRSAGETCAFGSVIGYLTTDGGTAVPTAPEAATRPGPAASPSEQPDLEDGAREVTDRSSRVQAAVAAAVTRSHREIPAAFATASCDLEPAFAALDGIGDSVGFDLPALLVKAVGALRERFPDCYGSAVDGVFSRAGSADVAVTVDAGSGLFMPVIRRVSERGFEDVADDLMDLRTRAVDGHFADSAFADPAICLSLNLVDGITAVQPIILPPLVCIVSFAGVVTQLRLAGEQVREVRTVTVGLAYDHRFINGSRATEYLVGLRDLLADPAPLLAAPA